MSLLSSFPTVLGQGHNRPVITVGQNQAGQARGGSSTNSISAGEVVQIPEGEIAIFYLIGAVKRPGAFELPRDGSMFVSQALAEAGGPLESAKADEALLVRWDENGREEIPINVSEIMQGKKPDMPLQPNDVLFLPVSKTKGGGHPIIDPPIQYHHDDNCGRV